MSRLNREKLKKPSRFYHTKPTLEVLDLGINVVEVVCGNEGRGRTVTELQKHSCRQRGYESKKVSAVPVKSSWTALLLYEYIW